MILPQSCVNQFNWVMVISTSWDDDSLTAWYSLMNMKSCWWDEYFHMIVMMSDSSESISSSDLHTSVSCCRVTIVKQLISWLSPVFSVGSMTREIRNTQDPLLTSLTMIYLCKVGLNPVTQQYYLSTAQLSATSLNFMKPFIALYVVIPFAY